MTSLAMGAQEQEHPLREEAQNQRDTPETLTRGSFGL